MIFACVWAANRLYIDLVLEHARFQTSAGPSWTTDVGAEPAESFRDLRIHNASSTRVNEPETQASSPLAIDVSANRGPARRLYFGREGIHLPFGIGRYDPMTSAMLGLLAGCGAMVATLRSCWPIASPSGGSRSVRSSSRPRSSPCCWDGRGRTCFDQHWSV